MAGVFSLRAPAASPPIPVLLFVSFVTFGLVRLAPGDPVLIVLGGRRVDPATRRAASESSSGWSGDPVTQYVAWLGRAFQGDLGESYKLKQDVSRPHRRPGCR